MATAHDVKAKRLITFPPAAQLTGNDRDYKITSVDKVVDGDTVDVTIDLGFCIKHSVRVRLRDIDTPEVRTADPVEKEHGIMAKNAVAGLLKHECILRCDSTDNRDKFGRVLGTIITKNCGNASTADLGYDVDVNMYLFRNHYAVSYAGQSKDEIIEAHLQNRQIRQTYHEE